MELTVFYDDNCEFCCRCRDWLESQPAEVELRFEPAPENAEELRVVDESGKTWTGTDALIMCLWATQKFRGLSYRLSSGGAKELTARLFGTISKNRRRLISTNERREGV